MTNPADGIINAIMNNTALQIELNEAPSEEAYIAIIVRIGATLNADITHNAVRDYLAENQTEELSDMELEAVVGGKGNLTPEEQEKLNKRTYYG